MLKLCPNCEEEVEVRHGLCPLCGEEFHQKVKKYEMDVFEEESGNSDIFSGDSWGSEFES